MKNNNIIVLENIQDSIPRATPGTGTITARNDHRLITGAGTKFKTEVKIWDWIYLKANHEFRKVMDIMSDTELIIDEKFDSDPNGSAYFITPRSKYQEVEIETTGSGDALIDGKVVKQNDTLRWQAINIDHILPIDIDAITNSTTVRVTVTY